MRSGSEVAYAIVFGTDQNAYLSYLFALVISKAFDTFFI